MPLSPDRAARLIDALLASLDNWIEQAEDCAANAAPGNKARCLHLQRSLIQGRQSMRRIVARQVPEGQDGEGQQEPH